MLKRCEEVPKSTCCSYSSYRKFLLSTCSVYRQSPSFSESQVLAAKNKLSRSQYLVFKLRVQACTMCGQSKRPKHTKFQHKKTFDKSFFCPISVANWLKVRPHKSKNNVFEREKIPYLFCFLILSFLNEFHKTH
jgi:hypothetical protein